MLQTNHIPIVTWKEKQKFMQNLPTEQLNLIQYLDIMQITLIYSQSFLDEQALIELKSLLEQALQSQLEQQSNANGSIQSNPSSLSLYANLKRTLKAVLYRLKPQTELGDPFNYVTVKDTLNVSMIERNLLFSISKGTISIEQIRNYMTTLKNIYQTRIHHFIELLKNKDHIIVDVINSFLSLVQDESYVTNTNKKQISQDTNDLMTLIMARFIYKLNTTDYCRNALVQANKQLSLIDLLKQTLQDSTMSQEMSLMDKIINHQNIKVQKLLFNQLNWQLKKYQTAIVRSLQTDKLLSGNYYSSTSPSQIRSINVLLLDCSPIILQRLFTHIINAGQIDDQFIISLKLTIYILHNYFKNHQNIGDQMKDFVFSQLFDFMFNKLINYQSTSLYDSNNSLQAKLVYTCLVMLNLILINDMQQEDKSSDDEIIRQGLHPQVRQKFIKYCLIHSDQNKRSKLFEWVATAIKDLQQGFVDGKCTLRIKIEEGVNVGTTDHIDGQNDAGIQLLRPVLKAVKPWKWQPLFKQTTGMFDLLDRKIATHLVLFSKLFLSEFVDETEKVEVEQLKVNISKIAQLPPSNEFLKSLGQQTLQKLCVVPKQEKDNKITSKHLSLQYLNSIFFEDFCLQLIQTSQELSKKSKGKSMIALTYKQQFQLHQMLSQAWQLATQPPFTWKKYVTKFVQQSNSAHNILKVLINLAYNLGDESANLCLSLVALALERQSEKSSIIATAPLVASNQTFDLGKIMTESLQVSKDKNKQAEQSQADYLDISLEDFGNVNKLLQILLLGKSSKVIRNATAHIIKGIYESCPRLRQTLFTIFMDNFASLKSYGVNASQFLGVFAYMCNAQMKSNDLSESQIEQITKEVYQNIIKSNQLIFAHPNLDLYSSIQKICSQNGSGGSNQINAYAPPPSSGLFGSKPPPQQFGYGAYHGGGLQDPSLSSSRNSNQSANQFIYELEPCCKCFEANTTPFRTVRAKDLQTESKFTDCTLLYRLMGTFEIKSFSLIISELKGYKTIESVSLYVNNKQGMDLAEMKNNWPIWKKVTQIQVDTSQKVNSFSLPLPVTASNILIELNTANVKKRLEIIHQGGNRLHQPSDFKPVSSSAAPGPSSNQEGLDLALSTLSQDVTKSLTIQSQQVNKDNSGAFDKEQIICPRCNSLVKNAHGICNSCGDNALYCHQCRNINYEKPDPFICKECGVSRYGKFDFQLQVKQGFATENIESEEMKANAEQQIETHLQTAQQQYQSLMKKRSNIQVIMKGINENSGRLVSSSGAISQASSSQDYANTNLAESQGVYQNMMKSLNIIKALKMQISQYQASASVPQKSYRQSLQLAREKSQASNYDISENEQSNTEGCSCFGCIQEYLRSQLSFIETTSGNKSSMKDQYLKLDMLHILYTQNLRMYSQVLQLPARLAICSLVNGQIDQTKKMLSGIEKFLFSQHEVIPAHLLSQILTQESMLLLKLIDQDLLNMYQNKEFAPSPTLTCMWRVLFKSLQFGEQVASIAESVTFPIIYKINKVILQQQQQSAEIKSPSISLKDANLDSMPVHDQQKLTKLFGDVATKETNKDNKKRSKVMEYIINYMRCCDFDKKHLTTEMQMTLELTKDFFGRDVFEQLDGQNWVVKAITINSSQRTREESSNLIKIMLQDDKELKQLIVRAILKQLDHVLESEPQAGDQYFELLTNLISKQDNASLLEAKRRKRTESNISASDQQLVEESKEQQINSNVVLDAAAEQNKQFMSEIFRTLVAKVDSELLKLVTEEKQREQLGSDGFMPKISSGVSLCRIMTIVSQMMKKHEYLKEIIQQNVAIVLKSLLKIRKLNLMKNKEVQNCEHQIELMFKELNSERDEDKSKFIMECIKLCSQADDLSELRFLFEEIYKIINPSKPELEYWLYLRKAQSNEEFIPGKMGKNPYSSKGFGGKKMSDVRLKICRDCDIGEPEMLELIIANKIIGMDLPITAVYEQVWWPYAYKKKFPESYEVPDIYTADPQLRTNMNVIFRLAGMDGEATEERVETLNDDSNPSSEKEIEAKFKLARVLSQQINDQSSQRNTTGVSILLDTLTKIEHLQENKDLASWLIQLVNVAIKLKDNRIEFLKHPNAVSIIAQKLFQSVGMQSRFDGKNEQSLFDFILIILETLILEMQQAQGTEQQQQINQSAEEMQIDTVNSPTNNVEQVNETATHIEIFLNLIADACSEMLDKLQTLDQTSKKIIAASRILPHLIDSADKEVLKMLTDVIKEHVSVDRIDSTSVASLPKHDLFESKFYQERIIDILENIPQQKNFIKDAIMFMGGSANSTQVSQIFDFASKESLSEPNNERIVSEKYKDSNLFILRMLKGLLRNHPQSQALANSYNLIQKLYTLSQQKFKQMKLVLLADDIIKILVNKNMSNDPTVQNTLTEMIDKKKQDQVRKAQLAKANARKRMLNSKNNNKYLNMLHQVKEEQGPKCVSCEDGYTNKPSEILGVYVFTKKQNYQELTALGSSHQIGATTVTHNNYIHFSCHQAAAKVDYEKQQRIQEWDGATTRNHLTLCNNLFPIKGGDKLSDDAFQNVVDRYFNIQAKMIGQGSDLHKRVTHVSHDLKSLFRRFAFEESFSRDSKGGGPEHNMQFIPYMVSMIAHTLLYSQNDMISHSEQASENSKHWSFNQEKKMHEYIEQSIQQQQVYMKSMEEAKMPDEVEEEVKMSDSEDPHHHMMHPSDSDHSMEPISAHQKQRQAEEEAINKAIIDQLIYFMSQWMIFGRQKDWTQCKAKFLSIILHRVVVMRETYSQLAEEYLQMKKDAAQNGNQLRIYENENMNNSHAMNEKQTMQLWKFMTHLRPLLIMLSLVDMIKTKWDRVRLQINEQDVAVAELAPTADYLKRLKVEYLTKGNLKQLEEDCNLFNKEYQDRILKITSLEKFLEHLQVQDKGIGQVVQELEKYGLLGPKN